MCKFKDTNLGIKKLDFNVKRGAMAAYLTDGREIIVPRVDVSRHQAPHPQAARGVDDNGRPVFLVRGSEQNIFRQRLIKIITATMPPTRRHFTNIVRRGTQINNK